MAHTDVWWTGKAIRARMRVLDVDPVTEAETPNTNAAGAAIRFRSPNGTLLSASGVVNAGNGYYYNTAVPTTDGIHTVEFETGGANPGRDKQTFTVEAF